MLVEANTHRVRVALSLIVASSVLQCVLAFAIYEFHLNALVANLLALASCLPIFAMIALAARTRVMNPDAFPSSYLIRVIPLAAAVVASSFLMVAREVLFFPKSLFATSLPASFPIAMGIVPAFLLLMTKRMMGGSNLGEILLPVRIKVATPRVRLAYRLTAFLIVYTAGDFASEIYFDKHSANGVLAYAVVLLPVLLIFGLIPIYNRYMAEEQDEFQRHLFNQSVLWALLGTLIVVCGAERLEDYALIFHSHRDFLRRSSAVWVFYFLQLEAGFVVRAIQAARLKRNQ